MLPCVSVCMYYTAKRMPCQPLGLLLLFCNKCLGYVLHHHVCIISEKRITRQPVRLLLYFHNTPGYYTNSSKIPNNSAIINNDPAAII
jgi:hypothetical protein